MHPSQTRALFVAGQHFEDGPSYPVLAPWSGEPLAEVVHANAERASLAATAAVAAFPSVASMPSHARRDSLRRIALTIEERAEDLAMSLALEAGKPITYARAEVARAVSTFTIASEEATRMEGGVMPLDVTPAGEGYVGIHRRVPAGPVLGIAPFNFPLNLVAHKVAPALASGCSIVLKPPPQAPLSALRLAEIVRDSGFPENALQVVPCDVDVAEALVRDERFATLSFTGSAVVGWRLKSIAGKKRVVLELGGNAATIVHEDANLEHAVKRVLSGAFGYAGQVCIKVQRLYLHEPIADLFVKSLLEAARALEVRPPIADGILSCMIDEKNAQRVVTWVDEAKALGASVLLGAERNKNKLGPIILGIDGEGRGLRVVDEEVFGPVLTVHRYRHFRDALSMADATRYGLQAGLFTDSTARIQQAFESLHVGGLVVGDVPTFRVDSMPYGGSRDSGLGREGVRFAMEDMTERKLMVVRRA